MSLFNLLQSNDPAVQNGLLNFGLALLRSKGSFGNAVGQAGVAGQLGARDYRQQEALMKRAGINDQILQMQLAEQQQRQKDRESALAQQAKMDAYLASMGRPVTGITGNQGPTKEAAARVGQVPPIDPVEAIRMLGPDLAQKVIQSKDWGRPKVARTAETEEGIQQLDEYGQPVGSPLSRYVAPVQVNRGSSIDFVKPQAGVSLPVGMSPEARDASARGWANVNLSRDRLAMDKDRKDNPPPPKPMPTTALKMQQEALDKIGVASSVNADLAAIEKQIEDGKLSFGPVSNLLNKGRNIAGRSTDESRNFGTFVSSLERLRNESLRLNTGVQTEGDAQRAWNELFQSVNDTELVKQRLKEIQRINKRAVDLQRLQVDGIRANYGYPQLDTQQFSDVPSAVGGATGSWDADKEARYQKWKEAQK